MQINVAALVLTPAPEWSRPNSPTDRGREVLGQYQRCTTTCEFRFLNDIQRRTRKLTDLLECNDFLIDPFFLA